MRYISLFAGIGGFDLALNRLGHECVWANEWDKYATQIYERNFNEQNKSSRECGERTRSTECLRPIGDSSDSKGESWEGNKGIDTRDIRTVPTSEIPNHDLLVGGFPCQAFSIAGKRRGFDDTRGTLFFEIARILKDKQPKFFILENVKGLLSHDNGSTFKTIISTLTELGYDLQWQVLNSKDFGVPQNRERVFIVGHLRGTSRPEVFPIRGTDTKDIIVSGVLDTETWRKRHEQIRRVHSPEGISPTIPTGTGGGVMNKIGITRGRSTEPWTPEDIAPTVRQGDKADVRAIQDMKVRRLTPTECERLQGFPDGWTEKGINEKGEEVTISDTQRYKTLGNAVTVNVVYEVARRLNG